MITTIFLLISIALISASGALCVFYNDPINALLTSIVSVLFLVMGVFLEHWN